MSKLLENKQFMHIASEVVVLLGVVLYFSNRNKVLSEHIEDLSQRLEDQEERIKSLENALRNLYIQPPIRHQRPRVNKESLRSVQEPRVEPRVEPRAQPSIIKVQVPVEVEESESDLDEQIADELKELNSSEIEETNLQNEN